jgi:preprotein translocase SecA subunit
MANLLTRVFGSANDRLLKKLQAVVREVADLEPHFEGLPAEEFPRLTQAWKAKLAAEEATLDEILPEAFAAVREASRRTIGLRHYDVQVLGGVVLHQGNIAEMKTGEGKTLVATLPLYLNALTGKGAHLVTVNDYLARRDVQWMGPIYHYLGLEVGSIIHDVSFVFDPLHLPKDYRFLHLRPVERRDAYRADITYGTNNEFGFDYLRDNLKFGLDEYAQRELNFAIVDEVDNILIDEARTPLIISGPAEESTEKYGTVDRIIPRLQRNVDYTIDEKHKNVTLTEEGVAKAERLLGVANLYDPTQIDMLHHVTQGLRAHTLFKRDVDYIVKEGEVIIVDEFTGRLMPGRRWSDGLHQAVEAKEGVRIERENQTLATITIQNYFRMYGKLAGMTGTADTESVEFQKTYKLDVVVIPPNLVMCREDHADVVYKTEREKFQAVVEEVRDCHTRGQPVLVGTTSVEKSESVSKLLKKAGVKHSVLNAINHEAEANIIAQAGRHGQVTIATNMAGRGTDILLGGNAEFLARAEMENEWLREARTLAGVSEDGQQARRYEDALRELRDHYNTRVSQAEHEYAEKLAAVEATREDAFGALIEAHAGIVDGAACGTQWERHEKAYDDVAAAIDNRSEVPARYLATAEKLHGALLGEDDRIARNLGEKFGREGSTMFAPERAVLKDRFAAYEEVLRKWNTDESTRTKEFGEGLLVRGGAYRFWTRVMQFALVVKPDARNADARRALEAYQDAWTAYGAHYERFCEEELPRHRDALRAAEAEFEAERTKYEGAIREIREKIEKAPHAYDERFQEMLAHYKETCAAEREQVVAAGGLHILGTERHEARRIDNQLRGRAGRQGDPGSSRFYLSLEDDLLRIFGADRMQNLMQQLGMEEGVPIEHRFVTRAIRNAQEKVEGHNFDIRKHLLEYDDVLNKQREVIYARRRELLTKEDLREDVLEMAQSQASDLVAAHLGGDEPTEGWDWKAFDDAAFAQFNFRLSLTEQQQHELDARRIEGELQERAAQAYARREEQYGAPIMRYLERLISLQTVDTLWREHLLSMEHLKEGIGLRGYGQKNPLQEYQKEGYDLFEELVRRMESDTIEKLWSVQVHVSQQGQATAVPAQGSGEAGDAFEPPPALPRELVDAERKRRQAAQQTQNRMRLTHGADPAEPPKAETVKRDGDKVGRNEPCPCGSGKKYKKCHGQAA